MSDEVAISAEALELARAVGRAAVADPPVETTDGQPVAAAIEGVRLVRLVVHADDRGHLIPAMDVRHPFWGEPVVYAYAITVAPGRIKGWGMHRLQTDRYFVASGSLRVVLFDGREGSPSCGRFVQFFFTDATPGLLRIPPGVWHADQNWGSHAALVVNYPTRPYDPSAPDKYRIDPHSGIIPFDWRLRDG